MDSDKKVKVSVVIKYVSDKEDNEIADKNSDGYLVLHQIKKLLDSVELKNEEESKGLLIKLLQASKRSNEILANALIDVDREDLFDEKVQTNRSIDDIIDTIIKL